MSSYLDKTETWNADVNSTMNYYVYSDDDYLVYPISSVPPIPEEQIAGVSRYSTYINGREYYPIELSYEKDVNMSPCIFSITLPSLIKDITMGSKVEIYRDGNLAFKGNVERFAKRANISEVSTVIGGRDLKWRLLYQKTDRYMYSGSGGNSATGSGEPADIVKDVISGSAPDLRPGIIETYGTTIIYPCRNYTKEKILKELQLFTGWEIDITTEGLVHFRPKVGLDRSDKIRFVRGINII